MNKMCKCGEWLPCEIVGVEKLKPDELFLVIKCETCGNVEKIKVINNED